MTFLYILSWISLGIQICFITVSIAAGLYYIAELVEEYTTTARKVIMLMVASTIFVYILFIFFDELPWSMVICGFAAQAFHFAIMQNFPYIKFLSVSFIGSLILLIVNHLLAFQHFTTFYYPFTEVLAYFTICLWFVPFALFVSLSANDNVLPTTVPQHSMQLGSQDVVSHYFSRGKKQGLLTLFSYLKETLLPTRSKKTF